MRKTIRRAATFVGVAMTVGACGGGGGHPPENHSRVVAPAALQAGPGTEVSALEAKFVEVVRRVSPTVVQIRTPDGLGSGVVYDERGDVVTNHHVVGDHRAFDVTLANGRTHRAVLVGTFPPDDLAVVRLEDATPTPATLGDSSQLRVGQFAFAIGNPLGLRSSVTQGIVSSLGRTVSEGPSGAVVASAIQTSAPINPGNSGGGLVDLEGHVIGIPTIAALDPELGGAQAPGIGFAIPSDTVKRIADQLIRSGHVTNSGRAYLGVRVATSIGGSGVIVADVQKGGPADRAGLRAGEVIVAVDHRRTPSTETLATILAQLRPGQRVPFEVVDAAGHRRTVTVTLGQLPPS
jgi:S1-C subfamily serine protease